MTIANQATITKPTRTVSIQRIGAGRKFVGISGLAQTVAVRGNQTIYGIKTFADGLKSPTFTFTTTVAPAYADKLLFWDPNEYCPAYYNDEAAVTHQIGRESWVRVRNESGATITNGSVVYVSGVEAGGESRHLIALAQADAVMTSRVIGVATHDIENNSYGEVTQFGDVNDFDTSALSVGPVWLSPTVAGGLTNTRPASPSFEVFIGYLMVSDASTGKLFVTTIGNTGGSTADEATNLTQPVRKGSAGTITIGQPVYISGYNVGQSVVEVELADCDATGQHPAIGLAAGSITNSANADVIVSGILTGINTSAWSVNDALYVSTTAGVLTNVRPTGTGAAVQSVARVLRSNASNGAVLVIDAGRENAIPNTLDAPSSAGLILRNSSGATVATFGAGPGTDTTFAGGITGTTATFSGTITNTKSGGGSGSAFYASSAVPSYAWNETDAGANAGRWDAVAEGGALAFRALTDADSATNWLQVTRSGGTPSAATFSVPVTLSGTNALTVGGSISTGGTHTFTSFDNASLQLKSNSTICSLFLQDSTATNLASIRFASNDIRIRDASAGTIATFTNTAITADKPLTLSGTNALTVGGNASVTGFSKLGSGDELTISAGVVTATGSYHIIDTESDAATDDLDTINGGADGQILVIRSSSSSRDVTVKDGTGNLRLAGDFTLDTNQDLMVLVNVAGSVWCELSRSNNT